jgi:hypothetical protein
VSIALADAPTRWVSVAGIALGLAAYLPFRGKKAALTAAALPNRVLQKE